MTKINQFSSEFSVSEFKGKQRMDSGSTAPHKQRSTVPEGFGASMRFMEQWKQAGRLGGGISFLLRLDAQGIRREYLA